MNFSQQIKHSNTDEWYTARENVEIIVPYLIRGGYKKILCPFDTQESQFVKVLSEYGFEVKYSHIWTGTDFFDIDLTKYDAIVSNPPFSKREAILKRLFESGKPFAIILNMNGLFDSKSRWTLFSQNKFELIVPYMRMKFSDGKRVCKSPNFQSIYVCKGMAEKQIDFIKPEDKQIKMNIGGQNDSV